MSAHRRGDAPAGRPDLPRWYTRYLQDAAEIFAPLQRREVLGSEALLALAQTLYNGQEPLPSLAPEQPLSCSLADGRYTLRLRVRRVASAGVELDKQGDELRVRLGSSRRTLTLPQYPAGAQLSSASLVSGHLVVVFEPASR